MSALFALACLSEYVKYDNLIKSTPRLVEENYKVKSKGCEYLG